MTLTDRDRKIVIAIVPLLLVVAYWFLLLAPKRDEATSAADALAKQEQRRDTAQTALDQAQSAKQDFSADYTQIVRLGKAIPASVDMPSLIVQLDAAAAGTGIRFTKIKTGDRAETQAAPAPAPATPNSGTPAAAGGQATQSAPGGAAEAANTQAQAANQRSGAAEQSGVSPADTQTSTTNGGGLPVGGGSTPAAGTDAAPAPPAGLETVPLELEFTGNFFNLADFFHRVKRFVRVANENVVVSGRLITVEGVRWSSDPELFPRIRAELKTTVYLSPKVEGDTAGATPAGPAPTTPASTPTPAESAPAPAATPTATATP